MPNHIFHLELVVNDPEALYTAAHAHVRNVDGLSWWEATEALQPEPGEISIEACLTALLDPGRSPPGTSIQESWVEVREVHVTGDDLSI